MKVSVLVPLYKTQESHLRAALDSILNQTFRDFELLLLDDSPEGEDRSGIVRSYQDSRIRYVSNETNLGISASRNKLINMAQGEYLAIMDHDDISLPQRLEKQVAYLDTHPEVGVVGCRVRELPSGKIVAWPSEDADIRLRLMYGCVVPHSASMIRRSVLTDNGIRYEAEFSPAEDYALWCRMIPYTKFHNLKEVLFEYRIHAGNVSHCQSAAMDRAGLVVQGMVRAANPRLYETYRLCAVRTLVVRLFNVLPLFSVVSRGHRSTLKLFSFIPLLSWKQTLKMK